MIQVDIMPTLPSTDALSFGASDKDTRSIQHLMYCPRYYEYEGSDNQIHIEALSHSFCTRCLRFTIGIASLPCKTRFRLLTKLYRAGRHLPARFYLEVSVQRHPLLPDLSWRNVSESRSSNRARENRRPRANQFAEGYPQADGCCVLSKVDKGLRFRV